MKTVLSLTVLSVLLTVGCDNVVIVHEDDPQPNGKARPLGRATPDAGATAEAAHSTVTITDANFEERVVNSSQVVLIDFWAPWCGPCLQIAPAIEEIAAEYQGRAVVGKVNVDDNPELAKKFSIDAIPALLVFKGGKPVGKIVGAESKDRIVAELKKGL